MLASARLALRRNMGSAASTELSSPRGFFSPAGGAGALGRCNVEDSVLFVCDIQQRFQDLGLIHEMETVKTTSHVLIKAARILGQPIVVSEQYPEKLGPTVPELSEAITSRDPEDKISIIPKTRFSMVVDDNPFRSYERNSIILCGIETHVCVLQTTLDLLGLGYSVFVVKDGVSSQRKNDRAAALARMRDAGAVITTAESVIFDLMRDSKHPQFKQVSKLVQWRNSQPNAFATEE